MRKKQDQTGEPMPYKDLPKSKSIKSIRGIYKLWCKAPKYILKLATGQFARLYIHENGKEFTSDRKLAKKFAHGFDNPEVKRDFWEAKISNKIVIENL